MFNNLSSNPYYLIFWALSGIFAAVYAKKVGKNPVIWFLIGFFLGAIGIFAFMFFGKKTQKPVEVKETVPVLPSLNLFKGSWYYAENGQILGPVSDYLIKEKFETNELCESTLVWHESMSDWTEIKNLMK